MNVVLVDEVIDNMAESYMQDNLGMEAFERSVVDQMTIGTEYCENHLK
jgi:hypothetical protein